MNILEPDSPSHPTAEAAPPAAERAAADIAALALENAQLRAELAAARAEAAAARRDAEYWRRCRRRGGGRSKIARKHPRTSLRRRTNRRKI